MKNIKYYWSTYILLYPICGTIWISNLSDSITFWQILGYGISQLGYLMIAAGLISGTFKVFNLRKRFHVLGVAMACLVIGIYFSNISSNI